MEQATLRALSEEELLLELKKRKQSFYMNAFIVGFLAGIAAYSTFKNGAGFFTFLPVVFIAIAAKSNKAYKAVKAEVELRKNNGVVQ